MSSAADVPAAGGSSPGGSSSAAPCGPGRRWASGRWSLEVRGDELADIRCNGHVVLRAVRAVARDEDWATAWPRDVSVEARDDELTLDLRIHDLGLDLAGTLRITADGDRLRVDLDLEARTDSSTNRAGLVVLHPPQLAGTPLQVTHPAGDASDLEFPVQVSPHQPAKDITGLAWETDGLALRLAFEGEVFEMEDQRNWTDASYKTYSRPLDLPFPYTLAAGARVRQRLVLTAGPSAGGPSAPATDGVSAEELTWHRGGSVPRIGTGHLDVELADPDWPQRLEAALAAADRGLALWVVSPTPTDLSALAELGRRLTAAVEAGAAPRFIGVADDARHVTTPELAASLREVVPPGVPLVAGARSHYTELNREWDTVLAAEPEALAFATTPLFHTLETEQLIESVAMQRLLVEQLTARVPGLPVHVGPITLRPRFANVATRPQPVPAPAPPTDPRAGTALHEAWTVASAAALAIPGVASLTYEQVPAELATLGRTRGPAPDDPLRSAEDLPDTTQPEEESLVTARSDDGLVWAIGDGTTLLLANLSGRPRRLHLPDRPSLLDLDPVSWRAL